jgi:hypothetical protein
MASQVDRLGLSSMLESGANIIQRIGTQIKAAEIEAAELRASASVSAEMNESALPPWETLSEQYAILQPELERRCRHISTDATNFTLTVAEQWNRERPGLLPGCLQTAGAALAQARTHNFKPGIAPPAPTTRRRPHSRMITYVRCATPWCRRL